MSNEIMKTYGPAVLGQSEFDRIQKQTQGGKDIFGPAVTGYKEPEPEEPKQAPSHLSVGALRTVMEANPSKMDYFLSAEWEREGGPRKSALQLFLSMEGKKESPRQVLLDRLSEALAV